MIKIKRKNPFIVLVVIFGLLIFLHTIKVLQPVERLFFNLIRPVSGNLYRWGTNISLSYEEKQEKEKLFLEIENLRQKVASLAIDKAQYQEIVEENKKLRSQLNFSSQHDFDFLIANVVAKEGVFSSSNSRDLIIDKGKISGLRKGLAVLSEEGVVIGKIVETKEESARVCLTTSPGCQLAASLQNEGKTQGLTNGHLGLTIEMNYIPQLEKISIGDIVITSGLSTEIPRGLVIGKVAEVRSESNEVWQTAIIEPILNFDNLTLISVVIP
jgi:rod shape-determining protein MreC